MYLYDVYIYGPFAKVVLHTERKRWKSNQFHGAFDAVSAFQCLQSVASHSALLEVMARPSPTTQVKVLD